MRYRLALLLVLLFAVTAAWAALHVESWPLHTLSPIVKAGLLVFLLYLPGGTVIRLLHPRPLGPALHIALALGLSPFVLGVLMTILLFAGLDAEWAAPAALLPCVVGHLYAGKLRRRRRIDTAEHSAAKPAPGIGPAALAAVAVLTALLAVPIARSNRVRTSIHGMLHASLLYSAVDRGVPPENPFFAGEQVRYYWTWHVAMAGACHFAEVEPTIAFAASNLAALLAFLLLLGQLGADLFPWRGSAPLAVLLGCLCLNPLGALFFVDREATALGEGRPVATLEEVSRGQDPITYIHDLTIGGDDRISATFTKFMNVSSFPTSFALLIAAWLLLLRLGRKPDLPLASLALLAVAGCIALSPVTGLTAGLALGAAAVALLLPVLGSRSEARGALLAVIGALAAGLLLAAPFVALGGAGKAGDTLALSPDSVRLTRILWNLGPVILLALPAAVLVQRRGDRGARLLLWSLPALLALAVLLHFPVDSEYKLVRMAAPLLGVFAAGSVAWFAGRLPRGLAVTACVLAVLAFMPTNALAWNCYLTHSSAHLPFHGEGTLIVVDEERHPVAAMYEFIRTQTPADAVIIDNPDARRFHFAGPWHGDELPALAHRPVFTDLSYYMNDYEPALNARMTLVKRIFAGNPLSDADYRLLLALRRPVFLLARAYDQGYEHIPSFVEREGRWQLVKMAGNALLFRLSN